MPLTVKLIEKLSGPARYFDERGLYLQVRSASRKNWLYRYEISGRERWMGLGSWPDVTLADARERAQLARQTVRSGRDPISEKRAAKLAAKAQAAAHQAQSKTFAVVAQEYFDQHQVKWGNPKHKAQFLSTLKLYAFPIFGQVPVGDIDRSMVLKVLDPIWGTKTETARRVRGRIENVLAFASIRGYRTGDNPARWNGNLELVFPERAQVKKLVHHRALP